MNSMSLLDKFNCSIDPNTIDNVTYLDTSDYIKNQIMKDNNGAEILISTKKGFEKVDLKDSNEY
jgi:hypothetical protein